MRSSPLASISRRISRLFGGQDLVPVAASGVLGPEDLPEFLLTDSQAVEVPVDSNILSATEMIEPEGPDGVLISDDMMSFDPEQALAAIRTSRRRNIEKAAREQRILEFLTSMAASAEPASDPDVLARANDLGRKTPSDQADLKSIYGLHAHLDRLDTKIGLIKGVAQVIDRSRGSLHSQSVATHRSVMETRDLLGKLVAEYRRDMGRISVAIAEIATCLKAAEVSREVAMPPVIGGQPATGESVASGDEAILGFWSEPMDELPAVTGRTPSASRPSAVSAGEQEMLIRHGVTIPPGSVQEANELIMDAFGSSRDPDAISKHDNDERIWPALLWRRVFALVHDHQGRGPTVPNAIDEKVLRMLADLDEEPSEAGAPPEAAIGNDLVQSPVARPAAVKKLRARKSASKKPSPEKVVLMPIASEEVMRSVITEFLRARMDGATIEEIRGMLAMRYMLRQRAKSYVAYLLSQGKFIRRAGRWVATD